MTTKGAPKVQPPAPDPGLRRTIEFRELPEISKLGWIAVLDVRGGPITLYHGHAVEHCDKWMAEGVWDSDFAQGEFHRSENFFGSGLQIYDDSVYIAASTALVDRVLYCLDGNTLIASNSLVWLLAFTGATLDPSHDYRRETYAIQKGISDYESRFAVIHPRIPCFFQLFEGNMVIRGGQLSFERRTRDHEFGSYDDYIAHLKERLKRIGGNMRDGRRVTRLDSFCTLSSGYDSAMVATLVRDIGVRSCFTSYDSNSVIPRWLNRRAAVDDGTPIAEKLGLKTEYLRSARKEISPDELYFIAPTCAEPELVFHSMAKGIERTTQGAVVFTGFHGDTVWDVHTPAAYLGNDVKRGGISGLNLCEIRLKAGFINVAVPFIGARNIRQLAAISRAPEMEPWRVRSNYDRPIPRRTVENAGVPRSYFGQRKKAVVQHYGYPVNRVLRRDFFHYLWKTRGIRGGFAHFHSVVNRLAFPFFSLFSRVRSRLTGRHCEPKIVNLWPSVELPYWMFLWATGRLARNLRTLLERRNATLW